MPVVYRIVADPDRFAWLDTADRGAFLKLCPFDGTALPGFRPVASEAEIETPPFRIAHSERPHPDIWSVCGLSHAFAFSKKAWDIVGRVAIACGQTFSVRADGETFIVLNVTHGASALNRAESKFAPNDPEKIEEYVFRENRLDYSLFKIPETRSTEVLALAGVASPVDEFKPVVEKHGLTGVRFELLSKGEGPEEFGGMITDEEWMAMLADQDDEEDNEDESE